MFRDLDADMMGEYEGDYDGYDEFYEGEYGCG
jgi:hypothetical protein